MLLSPRCGEFAAHSTRVSLACPARPRLISVVVPLVRVPSLLHNTSSSRCLLFLWLWEPSRPRGWLRPRPPSPRPLAPWSSSNALARDAPRVARLRATTRRRRRICAASSRRGCVLSCELNMKVLLIILLLQGLLLQTQFWDTNPSTGPSNSWTIHGAWTSSREDRRDF